MPNDHDTDHLFIRNNLTRIRRDIRDISRWSEHHDERHLSEDRRLDILLQTSLDHDSNHHGPTTKIKEGGLLTAFIAILFTIAAAIAKITSLPFPF